MKKIFALLILNSILASIIIAFNFIYLKDFPNLFMPINILSLVLIFLPIIIFKYFEFRKRKEIEENFPVFLRDFVEAIRSGMTIPQAFNSISKNDYGALSPYVKKISAQLEWGLPMDKVLLNFAKSTKSNLIGRIVSSVIESHRYGGNLTDTFEALSNTAVEVDRLKAERRLYLQSQLITGYIIFFVFLAVILGLEKFLVPSLTESVPIGVAQPRISPEQVAHEYKEMFRNLILIQGFFAGLSVGKMAEGAIIAGIKHSLFMMFVGGLVFSIFG